MQTKIIFFCAILAFLSCEIAFAQYDRPALNCTLQSRIQYDISASDSFELADIGGYENGGRQYALVCARAGIIIYDVTGPLALAPDSITTIFTCKSIWHEIEARNDKGYAYFSTDVACSPGIGVIDLTGLPASASLTGYVNDLTYPQAHTIESDGNFLYTMGGSGNGLRVLDISVPGAPVDVGGWPDTYLHDAFIINDTVYGCAGTAGLTVLDAINKSGITTIVSPFNPGTNYLHNADMTNDHKYLFTTEEVGTPQKYLRVLDISDLSNITQIVAVRDSQSTAGSNTVVHNVYIRGNYAYCSYYQDGLVIFDIACPEIPVEVGRFDTSPLDGSAGGYAGAWAVYPFAGTGNIYISDIEEGFFVVNFDSANAIATRLSGKVTDKNGNPLKDVTVSVVGKGSGTTNLTGDYGFGFLNGGDTLEVTLTANGYGLLDTNIIFTLGECKTVGFALAYGWKADSSWSMVSFPFIADDSTVATQVPTKISLFSYSGVTYNSETKFTRGVGYWLNNSVKSDPLTVKGSGQQLLRNLQWNTTGAKWFMFGGGSWDMPMSDLITSGSGSILSVWTYDTDWGYLQADTMKKGKGYWLNVSDSMNIQYDASTFIYPRRIPREPLKQMDAPLTLTFTNAKNQTREIGIGFTNEEKVSPELPPLPPIDAFDIRINNENKFYKYQTRVQNANRQSIRTPTEQSVYYVDMQAITSQFPVEISFTQNVNDGNYFMTVRDAATERVLNQKLYAGQTITLDASYAGVKKLKIELDYMNTENFSRAGDADVSQNYPNPFSGNTSIDLVVAKNSEIGINLYDLMGRRVREIPKRTYEAGIYTITWNRENLPGGIYFYEIRTQSGTVIRKCTIL